MAFRGLVGRVVVEIVHPQKQGFLRVLVLDVVQSTGGDGGGGVVFAGRLFVAQGVCDLEAE